MDYFTYKDAALHCESLPMQRLAEEYGTPLYVYSKQTIVDHFGRLRSAFAPIDPWICYSIKSCSNLAILRILKELGAAFDVVSGGELRRALEIGADPSRIVFAGVGKTDDEIRFAIDTGIGLFNVESEQEMANIARIAADLKKTAHVALRINPDVDPHTHQYTTTGKRETKFGVDWDRAKQVFEEHKGDKFLDLCGLHIHLGSPVNTVEPYVQAIKVGLDLIDGLREQGLPMRMLNLGGGFGAHYDGTEAPSAADYAQAIVPLLANRDLHVLFEPGRSIIANAGVLLTRVLYTKESGTRKFAIVDAATTELIRPALYGSFHFVWPVSPPAGMVPPARTKDMNLDGCQRMDVVGPVCESSDFLAKDRMLPPVKRGDLLCVFTAGAYGFTMASQYNSRPRVAEVLVEGDSSRLIRRRETYDDLVMAERI